MDNLTDMKAMDIPAEGNPYLARIRNGELVADVLGDALATLQRQAEANGLTDEILDQEIAAWYAELKA